MIRQKKRNWTGLNRKSKLLFLVAVSMTLLGSAIYFFAKQNNWLENEFATQVQNIKLNEEIAELSLYIKNAESADRGYVISGDRKFVENFDAAIDSIRAIYSEIQQLENRKEDGTDAALFFKSDSLVKQKIAFMQRVKSLCDNNECKAAAVLIASNEGLHLSDSIVKINKQIGDHIQAQVKRSQTGVLKARRRNNNLAYISITVSMLLILLVFYFLIREIRKTKNINEDLRVRKENFRITLNSLGEGLITTDTEGRIIYMNPAAEGLTGWSWQEAKSQPLHHVFNVINETTGTPIENIVSRILKDGKKIEWENNTILKAKNTGTFIISNNGSPLLDLSGRITGAVLVFNDITEKQKMLNELKGKEKQYRSLIQNLPEAVYTCDASGYIQLYNKAAVELWGREPVAGKDLWCGSWKIFNTDGSDLPLDSCPMAICLKEGRPVHGKEIMVQRPDGNFRHVLPYPSPLFNTEGQLTGAINMLIDVTTKKGREILIKQSEEKYRNFIEQASDAIVIYSFDGAIHEFNNSACTLSGYTNEEFSKLKLTDILVGELIANPDNYDAILAGKIITFSRQMKRKDGILIDLEVTVKMLTDGKVIAFGRDITERKKAEEIIKKEKELSDSVINSLPGIFYLYDETPKLLRWNKSFETISGYSSEEISSMNPQDFFEGAEKKYMIQVSQQAFKKGANNGEAHFVTKQRERIPFYFTGLKIKYEGRNSILGTGIDITERKKAEEEIHAINKQLRLLAEHLQKIREEEQTRIAREIHDELGQQLTVMKMDVAWLSEKIGKKDESIRQRVEELKDMLDKTVITVRRIASELRPSMLDDMGLAAAIDWHLSEFGKRSGVKTEFDKMLTELPLSDAVKTGLFRIVQESLTNVGRYANAKKVTVSLQQKDGQVVLTIKDNGIGFDEEKIAAKKTLGILGMKERTIIMGGTYEISSASGKGTMVTVRIPFAE